MTMKGSAHKSSPFLHSLIGVLFTLIGLILVVTSTFAYGFISSSSTTTVLRAININSNADKSIDEISEPITQSNENSDGKKNVVISVSRLNNAVAKAAAQRQSSASNTETIIRKRNYREKDEYSKVSNLTQLTKIIDKQLYSTGPRGTARGDYPSIDGIVHHARDNMMSLLGFNQIKGDWKKHASTSTYNVAVVFGKQLVRDQITIEYASRIRTLAKLFKENEDFAPSLVCFCGATASNNHISNADAGFIFFRHMCEAQNINLDDVGIFIDNKSIDDEHAIRNVVMEVQNCWIPKWVAKENQRQQQLSSSTLSNKITSTTTTTTPSLMEGQYTKKIQVHFTLVSTEYHLCNINDVHHRSPTQTLLTPIESLGERDENKSYSNENSRGNNYFNSSKNYMALKTGRTRAAVKTSFSFQYATYPFIYAKDETVVFLGKCFLLGEELRPLWQNMKGVVERKEFFQRDNYVVLASIRRSLVHYVEALLKPNPKLEMGLKLHARTIYLQRGGDPSGKESDIVAVLEGALVSLGRCVDLVKPAGLLVNSVPKTDWAKAIKALERSMNDIRELCDPDRPIASSEWGKLIDD